MHFRPQVLATQGKVGAAVGLVVALAYTVGPL